MAWGDFDSGGFCPGGFCPGFFVWGGFVQGDFVLSPFSTHLLIKGIPALQISYYTKRYKYTSRNKYVDQKPFPIGC